MAEFKKISDVDVIDALTESDNILIVGSDGALKQTSSANIKGGGTVGYVLKLTEDNYAYVDYAHQCLDNYDEIYDILMSGGIVWIDWTHVYGNPILAIVGLCELTSYGFELSTLDGDILLPNGSHNLPEAPAE